MEYRTVSRTVLAYLCAFGALLSGPAAGATGPAFDELKAQGPQAVLAHADKLANHYPTQQWVIRMTVNPGSDAARSLKLKVWQKDQKMRLIRFLEPGDVKGTSVLTKGASLMYVYSPQTMKVRRVANSARRQTMLGSNYTFDDMATIDLGDSYQAALDKDDGRFLWLELTAKPDASPSWPRLRVRIDSRTKMYDRIEFYEGNRKVRVEKRENFTVADGVPSYRRLTMTTVATKLKTMLEVESQVIGEPLSSGLFKQRNLVRGN